MRALFHSKLSQQLRSTLVVGFMLFCLLGTHWIGFSHGIAHIGLATSSQSLGVSSHTCDENSTITHSSASCHLFDALTLASFTSTDTLVFVSQPIYTETSFAFDNTVSPQATQSPYQSQAPPRLTL